MSDPDLLKERIVEELERERQTHKSLRLTLSEKYDYSEEAVSRGISTLHDAGVITHDQGFFELTNN
ncbi:hypothetical protein [Natrinema ejinorense]|uniref:MarR family transcriptional regulator n=1 Tax=Natrinema ejinorense TaxID=373386 RepID=A0A2A5QPH4_9EURY|nr:hypothetical protein [Natrinema ejinorense]PCR88756.1 hypothetical protein CP557_19875 [Natrinema ejinorense]